MKLKCKVKIKDLNYKEFLQISFIYQAKVYLLAIYRKILIKNPSKFHVLELCQKHWMAPWKYGTIALSYPPFCYWWLIMKKCGWKLYCSPNPNFRGVRKCNSAENFWYSSFSFPEARQVSNTLFMVKFGQILPLSSSHCGFLFADF